MKILIIADSLAHIKINKDSTFAMMKEASARHHELFSCGINQILVSDGKVSALANKTLLANKNGSWFHHESNNILALSSFDAVLMRKDPPFNLEYLYATHLLTLAEKQGARVFNSGQSIRDLNEKLAVLQFEQFAPPSLVCRDSSHLRKFIQEEGDVILKPLDGMGGESIFRVTANDVNLSVILETMTLHDKRTIMAQRYIPEIREGDKRILLIAGKAIDYCLARIPKAGETRGNIAAGGHGEIRKLSARDREIVAGVGEQLWQRGVLLAGLDVIGDYLTEINVTSPTCFREITEQSGIAVAQIFIDELEKACS